MGCDLHVIEDYLVAVSAGVMVAASIILATFLYKYSKMVAEADQSTRLAKDVWDSVDSRFSVIDSRVIDLMAKTEVLSSRFGASQVSGNSQLTPIELGSPTQEGRAPDFSKISTQVRTTIVGESTETERKVLRSLEQGPKDSAQIRQNIGKSREHTARLMKSLFDRGLVVRNDKNKPYVYEITQSGRSYLVS